MLLRDLTAILFEGLRPGDKALLRVDAGRRPGLSFGHLERCALLARSAEQRLGLGPQLLMRPIPEGLARAQSLGLAVLPFEDATLVDLAAYRALVLDLPGDPEPWLLEHAARSGLRVVVLDDTGRDLCPCDVVLNSSVLATASAYPRARRTLLGPDFLILDERFAAARRRGSGNTSRPAVLVTFGGSDPTGLTPRLLSLVATAGADAQWTVALGPGFGDSSAVESAAQGLRHVRILRNPPDMLPLFTACDLAVCAGGRTLYELCALGVPTLAVASAPHEALAVRAFVAQGKILAGLEEFEPAACLRALKRLLPATRPVPVETP